MRVEIGRRTDDGWRLAAWASASGRQMSGAGEQFRYCGFFISYTLGIAAAGVRVGHVEVGALSRRARGPQQGQGVAGASALLVEAEGRAWSSTIWARALVWAAGAAPAAGPPACARIGFVWSSSSRLHSGDMGRRVAICRCRPLAGSGSGRRPCGGRMRLGHRPGVLKLAVAPAVRDPVVGDVPRRWNTGRWFRAGETLRSRRRPALILVPGQRPAREP